MADHNDFGKVAEDLAVDFLVKNQYKILVRNFRYLKAEVDIIAEFENQIVMVEVKARNTRCFSGTSREAVNKKKIKLLISASNYFIEENSIDKEIRFDIISVLPNKQKTLEIHHIIDAFQSFEI